MGLDNGICIKRNERSMNIYNKIKRFEDDWGKEHKYDFEVAYWRKCWNIRHLIFSCIGGCDNNGIVPIKHDDIPNIIDTLKSLNVNNWENYGSSIWEFEEQEPHNKRYIENLEYLYELMGQYDLDVYFYDSY